MEMKLIFSLFLREEVEPIALVPLLESDFIGFQLQ